MRLRQRAFIGDGGIKRGEVDHAHRLRAEHKRVIAYAFRIDFCGDGGGANRVEALFRTLADPAVEQMSGHHIDRILKPATHREHAALIVIGIARRPKILRTCIAAVVAADHIAVVNATADRRQRDRFIGHERVRLQAVL